MLFGAYGYAVGSIGVCCWEHRGMLLGAYLGVERYAVWSIWVCSYARWGMLRGAYGYAGMLVGACSDEHMSIRCRYFWSKKLKF